MSNVTKSGAPGNRTPLKIMINDKNKILVLSVAIVLGAFIIAFAIMNKPMSSLEHCYYKNYKSFIESGNYKEDIAAHLARGMCKQ